MRVQVAEEGGVAAEIASEHAASSVGAARVVRPQSFAWGPYFYFTRRDNPLAWQILCRGHAKQGSAACTKSCTFSTEAQSQQVIRKMKSWALRASQFDSKLGHQGARGLPDQDPAHRELTDENLDALMNAMPAL